MDQTFNALFKLNKAAVVRQVTDLTKQAGIGWVTTGNIKPWIFAQLLEAEGDTIFFLVVLQNLDLAFLANFNGF